MRIRKTSQYIEGGISIETGSNANGSYIKYSDGTLICYGQTTLTTGTQALTNGFTHYAISSQITLPSAFIDTNYQCVATIRGGELTGVYISMMNPNSESKANLSLVSATSNHSRTISWIVIGKWK